jgi:GT2 family glycosyltransferase
LDFSKGFYLTMLCDVTASIVIYRNDVHVLKRSIDSVLSIGFKLRLYVIDNSGTDGARDVCNDTRIEYVLNDSNVGFAAGHNIAIKHTIQEKSKYHLVLNPDVYFEKGGLNKLYDFMEKNPDVGLAMPRILYPDGSLQYLCKLLPTPMDLIRRRFFPSSKYSDRKNSLYELRFTGYNRTMDVPYLSGCFMFIRTEALSRAGLFDERFFMYLEDADLSRRIHKYYRTVYYPEVFVFHEYRKGSYKNWKLLIYHVRSAIRYFNKWGYLFDKERQDINRNILKALIDETGGKSR